MARPSGDPAKAWREGIHALSGKWPDLTMREATAGRPDAEGTSASRAPQILLAPTHRWSGALFSHAESTARELDRNGVLVGTIDGAATHPSPAAHGGFGEVGVLAGIPRLACVVPSDAASARALADGLFERTSGPLYVRLVSGDQPVVGPAEFELGRVRPLVDGSDITIVALGRAVIRAVEAAEGLKLVGIGARVLDAASVKPFDEKAILRAARDTGAIVVAEELPATNGVGLRVAAAVAENYPVPVRRIGLPDLPSTGGAATSLDDGGITVERIRDEAWEILSQRGKVT